ncbi:MAG: hypothetical protein JRI68_21685 [Deltaproteobacteria bacterium]|nr:hypothetical protein [Deltaproteobacteria bacterium]
MRSPSVLVALPLLLLGCDDGSKPTAGASSATATGSTKAKPTSTGQAGPPPKALAVESLKKALKCGAKSPGPCEVLAEFENCTPWNPTGGSGDGRWMGFGYVVKQGKFVDQLTVLRNRRVPLTEVGPGQLPVMIAIGSIPEDQSAVARHAPKAIRALSRGDVPKETSAAVAYLKKRTDWSENYAMKAEGDQIYVNLGAGAHLCGINNQRLVMMARTGGSENATDGIYAALYPVSW